LLAYVVRRILWAFVTLLFVASAVFGIFFVLPGGAGRSSPEGISPVAVLLAGRNASEGEMRAIQRELGLDDPLPVQYGRYIASLARGDLGFSFAAGAPVTALIGPAIPASLSIALGASLVWVLLGTSIGILSANRRRASSDRVAMLLALGALSLPVFVVAALSLSLLLQLTGIYAGNRYVPLTEDPVAWLGAMWLPWICLAFPLIAVYARMVRSSVLEVKAQDYMLTSWAKGLRRKDIRRHELRGALTPIVTMYGLDFGLLAGGSVIIETIFRIPGLGTLLLQARNGYDFPLIAAVVIVFSMFVIVANLVVDILYGYLDPRVRSAEAAA
jgi:peptide/nickel transport system permease protein